MSGQRFRITYLAGGIRNTDPAPRSRNTFPRPFRHPFPTAYGSAPASVATREDLANYIACSRCIHRSSEILARFDHANIVRGPTSCSTYQRHIAYVIMASEGRRDT